MRWAPRARGPRLSILSVARLVVSVRVTQPPQARHRRPGEGVAAEEVDVVVLEGGQPGEQLVGDGKAVGRELLDGGVDVEAVEQHHGVQGQAERAELVLSELGMLTAWGRLSVDRSLRVAADFLEDRRPSGRVAEPVLARVPDEDVTGAMENGALTPEFEHVYAARVSVVDGVWKAFS